MYRSVEAVGPLVRNARFVVGYSLEQYLRSLSPDDPLGLIKAEDAISIPFSDAVKLKIGNSALFSGNRSPKLNVDYRQIEVLGDEADLWRTKEAKSCLAHQARLCAENLLNPSRVPNDNDLRSRGYIRTSLWWAVNATPNIFHTERGGDDDRFLYALGGDLSKICCTEAGGVGVVPRTTIALPYDLKTESFYLPFPRNAGSAAWRDRQSLKNALSIPSEPAAMESTLPRLDATGNWTRPGPIGGASSKKNIHVAPAPERCPAKSFEEALRAPIPNYVALWCLEQQENRGRCYIDPTPPTIEEEDAVRDEHKDTTTPFREFAEESFVEKYGYLVPPKKLREFFNAGKWIKDRRRRRIFVYDINIHHKKLVKWGGKNDKRTCLPAAVHEAIHRDFDRIQKQVCAALRSSKFQFGGSQLPPIAQRLRTYLPAHPDVIDMLNEIPNVNVDKHGGVRIAILWPPEPFWMPSFAWFELKDRIEAELAAKEQSSSKRPTRKSLLNNETQFSAAAYN